MTGKLARGRSSLSPLPRLYFGKVTHRRLRPAENRFAYSVFFLSVPLTRVESLENRWFSVNRRNVFSLRFADYGARDGSHPLPWIHEVLESRGLGCADGEIWLQTFPRVLGYVFNPVSFFFCHDRAGALRAVLCEVNNTFGERHHYLLAHPDARPIEPEDTLTSRKVFHVSPFASVEGAYRFRFRIDGARTLARIDYFDATGDLLHTSISGEAAGYSAGALLRAFLRYPWMTLGVIARIHYQALRLWLKRVPFIHKPAPPAEALTR
jgi:DUF1365 family protein